MRTFGKRVMWGGLMVLIAAPAGTFFLTKNYSETVLMISPHDADVVELNKTVWSEGEPVAEIYGVPTENPVEIVFADSSKIIRPEQDPNLVLLKVDKQKGDNPLQTQTLWYLLKFVIAGSAAAIFFGALFLWFGPKKEKIGILS